MAPSPTGFLHIGGGSHIPLQTGSFARHHGGEFRLRIEEHGHEAVRVAEAVDQIQESLRWLGLDWDGTVTFPARPASTIAGVSPTQLVRRRQGPTRTKVRFAFACPDEGITAWDDVVRGRAWSFPNEKAGRTSCSCAATGGPRTTSHRRMEDVWDEITHVIRAEDHISKHAEADQHHSGCRRGPYRSTPHVPNVNGEDGKGSSRKRPMARRAWTSFRKAGVPAGCAR